MIPTELTIKTDDETCNVKIKIETALEIINECIKKVETINICIEDLQEKHDELLFLHKNIDYSVYPNELPPPTPMNSERTVPRSNFQYSHYAQLPAIEQLNLKDIPTSIKIELPRIEKRW